MTVAVAGIIANPASGKDIRRLVAHASVFDTAEKINIVRRVVLALEAAGVQRIFYMPDPSQIVPRAIDGLTLRAEVLPVDGKIQATAEDTTVAAAAMAAAGARVIVSLGGDGTNRVLAKGACDVPLVPISTGTNNVFPVMVEATVAGLAAGALASGVVDPATVARRCKWIEIAIDGVQREVGLIDAVVMEGRFVGSRAIWDLSAVREAVLTRAQPDAIGLAAVGGMVTSVTADEDCGLHLVMGEGGQVVAAAIAPGLVREVPLASVHRVAFGVSIPVTGPALLALDGEREFSLNRGECATMIVSRSGPPVVDIARCLAAARDFGFLR